MDKYTLDQTPVLAEVLDSGDTVTVALYNLSTGAVIPLDANSATEVGSTGVYRYTVDFTTEPPSGKNYYHYIFTGTLQMRHGQFEWSDEAGAFGGVVHVDTVGGSSGTDFPLGLASDPVDNITDAKTIADRYALKTFHVSGVVTLPALTWDGYIFMGDAPSAVTINLANRSIVGTLFKLVTLAGQCNGAIEAGNCRFGAITDLEGFLRYSHLDDDFTVKAGVTVSAIECFTTKFPSIECDLNGTALIGLTNFNGQIKISNMTNAGSAAIITGICNVESDVSITAGVMVLSGDVIHVDNATSYTMLVKQIAFFTVSRGISS